MVVNIGVVEIIERFPALARRNAIGRQSMVEIIGAIDMARIAHVVVIARIAGGGEGIMAPDRILDDLHQRLEIPIERL